MQTVDVHRVVELPPSESIPRPMIIEDSHCCAYLLHCPFRDMLDWTCAHLSVYCGCLLLECVVMVVGRHWAVTSPG